MSISEQTPLFEASSIDRSGATSRGRSGKPDQFGNRPGVNAPVLKSHRVSDGFQRHAKYTRRRTEMSILAWIVLGLLAGFIGSKIVNKRGEGFVLDIVLGIVGAVVGGFLFNALGARGVSGLNLYSLFVAVVGSVLLLVAYHAVVRRA